MAIATVDDVLEHAERFEQMLAAFYSDVCEHSSREGVRLLTDYMSRHRERIVEALKKMSPQQVQRICSAPLRYEPHAANCACIKGIKLPDNASAAEVLDTAVLLDECLISLYRQVLLQPVDQEILELFESLVRTEQRDEIQLKKIKAMDYF